MRSGAKPGIVGIAGVSIIALCLSACGSSSGSSSPSATKTTSGNDALAVVAAAFTKTSAVKSARVAVTYQVLSGTATSSSGINERGTGSGVINFATNQADLTVNEPTGQSTEERLISNVAYVKLPPALTTTIPQLRGKTWLRQPLSPTDGGALGFGTSGSSPSNPTSILQLVSKVSDSVSKVGTASVRGTPTTQYRATVNFTKAAAKQGVPATQIQTLEKVLGTNTFPVDVWIDAQGAARRLQFQFPLPEVTGSASGQSGKITETLDLFDFGIPVTVQTPPASQVGQLPASSLGAVPSAAPTGGVHTG
jgi:hypothetical protein